MKLPLLTMASVLLSISAMTTYAADESTSTFIKQKSRMYTFDADSTDFRVNKKPVRGAKAILKRNTDGLHLMLDSKSLESGIYTVWMRVFNDPSLCQGGEGVENSECSRGADIAPSPFPCVPDASGMSTCSVFWLSGAIVGDDGRVHVSTSLIENEWPGMVLLGGDAVGTDKQAVNNLLGAEIHVVLRYHGEAIQPEAPFFAIDPSTGLPSEITDAESAAYVGIGRQLFRVNGNCAAYPPYNEDASICSDDQLAVFSSPFSNKNW